MATKTITLNGAEQRVDSLGGLNALIVNNTGEPVYASAKAGVVPYADGVVEIKAGDTRTIFDTNGTVYLLGNGGRVELTGGINFNQPSRSSGGGGGVTRAEVNSIVTEKIAEVVANAPEDFDTLKEISDWIEGHEDSAAAMNSAIQTNTADISDIRTEQETQDSDISALQTEMGQKADISGVSNPNLLDNPDFRINQRENIIEDTIYVKSGYFFDRWSSHANLNYKRTDECLEIYRDGDLGGGIYLAQPFESNLDANQDYIVSIYTTSGVQSKIIKANGARHNFDKCDFALTQNQANIIIITGVTLPFKGIKLEISNHATPFIPPNLALETLKCQRYYVKIAESNWAKFGVVWISNDGINAIGKISLPIALRAMPTIITTGWDIVAFARNGNESVRIALDDTFQITPIYINPSECWVDIKPTSPFNESIRGTCGYFQVRPTTFYSLSANL